MVAIYIGFKDPLLVHHKTKTAAVVATKAAALAVSQRCGAQRQRQVLPSAVAAQCARRRVCGRACCLPSTG